MSNNLITSGMKETLIKKYEAKITYLGSEIDRSFLRISESNNSEEISVLIDSVVSHRKLVDHYVRSMRIVDKEL